MDPIVKSMLDERFESLPKISNLPPGWILLGLRPRFIPYLWKILCFNPEKPYQPYAVWTYNRATPGCSNGHYFQKIEDAERNFLDSAEFS